MKHRKTLENKRIILCLNLAHGGWRDFLSGFLEFSRTRSDWNLRIIDPSEFTPAKIDELHDKDVDGIVAGNIHAPSAERLVRSQIPLVLIGNQTSALARRSVNIAFVHHDDRSIGEVGHDNLSRLGNFSSWAFLPAEGNPYWSELRQRGFTSRHVNGKRPTSIFKCPFKRHSEEYEKRLRRWIASLPKPAAVMAACDSYAFDLIDACRIQRVNIPEQVSIIGVDNDTLLCETSTPTLSSIAPDHMEEGRLAVKALASLLRQSHDNPRTLLCSRKISILRESTSSAKPATAMINRALEFVKANATRNIDVSDVVDHLGVSRSLLELRFRQFQKKSLAKTILEVRLQEVRRQLLRTSVTFASISQSCGWKNPNVLKNAFRRHFGMSMREMRNQNEHHRPERR